MQQQTPIYAGFWLRLVAFLIDSALWTVIATPLLLLFYGTSYYDASDAADFAGLADILISLAFPTAAIVAFWKTRGATPCKMLLVLKIVDAKTGATPSLWRCIGRFQGYIISAIPLNLGFLHIAFSKKKRGWHDKLAGTVVIRVNTAIYPEAIRDTLHKQTPLYAGFKTRAYAVIIDSALLLMLTTPMLLLIYGRAYFGAGANAPLFADWPDDMILLNAFLPFYLLFYGAIYGADAAATQFAGPADVTINCLLSMAVIIAFWLARGATPSKMWLGMKIINAKTGAPPSLGQCIARYLGYFISAFLLLGFLWVARDQKSQGWHDKLAGTAVVYTSAAAAAKTEEMLC